MRLFVAVRPPDDAVEHLDAFLDPRRAAGDDRLRWTTPEQHHLTLAFLPDVADADLDDLVERLEAACVRRTPFELRAAGGGAFPDATRAKVVYAAVTGDGLPELDRLSVGARNAAVAAGCRVDGARFRPHVTLARLARPADVLRWLRVLDGYVGPSWPVATVELVRSHLGEGPRGRPRYETLHELRIGPEVEDRWRRRAPEAEDRWWRRAPDER